MDKELLKKAFEAGVELGHAKATGKQSIGLTYKEWVYGIINESSKQNKQCIHSNTEIWGNGIKCIDCGKSF